MEKPKTTETPAPISLRYNRADAVQNGSLKDLTVLARECGFTCPVAITRAAWEDAIQWIPGHNPGIHGQDETGRAWDVLWMFREAIHSRKVGSYMGTFTIVRIKNDGRSRKPTPLRLRAICGPGDTLDPCMTIMLPSEELT